MLKPLEERGYGEGRAGRPKLPLFTAIIDNGWAAQREPVTDEKIHLTVDLRNWEMTDCNQVRQKLHKPENLESFPGKKPNEKACLILWQETFQLRVVVGWKKSYHFHTTLPTRIKLCWLRYQYQLATMVDTWRWRVTRSYLWPEVWYSDHFQKNTGVICCLIKPVDEDSLLSTVIMG